MSQHSDRLTVPVDSSPPAVHVSAGSDVGIMHPDDIAAYGEFDDPDLEHVFNIIGFPYVVKEYFVYRCGLNTIARFAYNQPSSLADDVKATYEPIRIGDLQDYVRFYNFYHQKFVPMSADRSSSLSIRDVFTPDVWAECYSTYSSTIFSRPNITPTPGHHPTTAELQSARVTSTSTGGSVGEAVEPSDLGSEMEGSRVMVAPPTVAPPKDHHGNASPLRVEIKLFPTLKNLTTITGTPFLRWRNRFQTMARIAHADTVLLMENEHPIPLPSDPDYPTFMANDALILTTLLHATEGTNAASYVENQVSGRAAWYSLLGSKTSCYFCFVQG